MYIKIKCHFFCKSLLQLVDSRVAQSAALKRMLPVQEQNQWAPPKCCFFNVLAFCFLQTAVWTAISLVLHMSKEEIAWPCWLIIVVTFSVCFGSTSENLMKKWMLHPAGYSSHIQKLCFSDLTMAFSIPFLFFSFFPSFCINCKQPVLDKTKK